MTRKLKKKKSSCSSLKVYEALSLFTACCVLLQNRSNSPKTKFSSPENNVASIFTTSFNVKMLWVLFTVCGCISFIYRNKQ